MAVFTWSTYSPNTEPDNEHWVGIVVIFGDRYIRLFEDFEWAASMLTTWRNHRHEDHHEHDRGDDRSPG